MDNMLLFTVTTKNDHDHTVQLIGEWISAHDCEASGLSFEDFYNRFRKAFPSHEGFTVKATAERSERVDINFDSPMVLEEPVILEYAR